MPDARPRRDVLLRGPLLRLRALVPAGERPGDGRARLDGGLRGIGSVTSFGLDADGEVYVVDYDGEVYRLEPAGG